MRHKLQKTQLLEIDNDVSDYEFFDNKEVVILRIKQGVSQIGKKAFANCSELKEIFLPESLQTIAADAFENSGMMLRIFNSEIQNYLFTNTLMVHCVENSYADHWLKKKKFGFIKVYEQEKNNGTND